jgi:predicted Rossmann fold flavoprotein
MTYQFDVLILGAGAAGLMCAIEAGKRGRRVIVLEQADRAGKKILISGGGRCNFTNRDCPPESFISANPHFAKSALARYTPSDFIDVVEKHHIPYHEKTLGQLFCDRSAADIVEMLEKECHAAGVQIKLRTTVQEVRRTTGFVLQTEADQFRAPALVIATGGLSIPKMGATSFGYDLARQFGIKVQTTRPGLVPLLMGEADRARYCDLAGVSAEIDARINARNDARDHARDNARIGSQAFREKMLITHRGLSGPAILQISSYWTEGDTVGIDLAPGRIVSDAIRDAPVRNITAAKNALQAILPKRLAARWLDLHAPAGWSNQALDIWENQLHEWNFQPVGTEGFEKAEVTVGGVDTGELSSKSMECHRVPGLFFVGEVVDVTGHLGGFNFQWAWASGAAAGRSL